MAGALEQLMDDPATEVAIDAVEPECVESYWLKDRFIGALFLQINGMPASFSHQQRIEKFAQKYWLGCRA